MIVNMNLSIFKVVTKAMWLEESDELKKHYGVFCCKLKIASSEIFFRKKKSQINVKRMIQEGENKMQRVHGMARGHLGTPNAYNGFIGL